MKCEKCNKDLKGEKIKVNWLDFALWTSPFFWGWVIGAFFGMYVSGKLGELVRK